MKTVFTFKVQDKISLDNFHLLRKVCVLLHINCRVRFLNKIAALGLTSTDVHY